MDYDDMTVAELKDLLREAGLPVSGKKADLIARLQEMEDSPHFLGVLNGQPDHQDKYEADRVQARL